jgi:hypothetical protein
MKKKVNKRKRGRKRIADRDWKAKEFVQGKRVSLFLLFAGMDGWMDGWFFINQPEDWEMDREKVFGVFQNRK